MYKILRTDSLRKLELMVNQHMRDGWTPQGGPYAAMKKAVGVNSITYVHHQAMVMSNG